MNPRFDETRESDTTPSRELAARYREAIGLDDEHAPDYDGMATIHYRGTRAEYDLGMEYLSGTDPLDRVTGAYILAQLGWADRTFLDETVAALCPLLHDPFPVVVEAAAVSLGHRHDARTLPELIAIVDHPAAEVRRAIASAISGHDDPDAIRALIRLSVDPDRDVRSWAVFGLGTITDVDTPEIRDALCLALDDEDPEVRGEGLVGLAERRDPRCVPALLEEWKRENVGILSLEAAALIADSRLLESLQGLRHQLDCEKDSYFQEKLRSAVEACGGTW